ncbi:MAG: SMC family ATPase [Bacillota bacterium]|nr:SMC family ATPase [Bacillota bacterium]
MIIRKVRLYPFGAVQDREYSFAKGLNVVLGPNEAGKSTLVKAVFAVLFIPSDVRKNSDDWRGFLSSCLPYPAGDTARVAVEFDTSQQDGWFYSCSWGGNRDQCLVTADGSEVNDPEAIREHLQIALRYGRGTYEGILFARQDEMSRTLEKLKELPEATGTVAGLLRTALVQSGGVSLENLEEAIEKEYERLLNNWDLSADGPRGGRGIGNRHKQKVGDVLSAYYKVEERRRDLKRIYEDEARIAELNGKLDTSDREMRELVSRLKEYEQLEDDARLRSKLVPELEVIEQKQNNLKKIVGEWPRVEERIKGLEKEISGRGETLKKLEAELAEAGVVLKSREKRELLEKAGLMQEEITKKQGELAELPPLGREELASIEKEVARQTRLKSVIEAMKLKAKVEARKPLQFKFTAGMAEPQEIKVDEEILLEGPGRLLMESEDWRIDIQSGQQDVEELIAQAKQAGKAFRDELDRFGVDNIEKAKEIVEKRSSLAEGMKNARARLDVLLGGLDCEELKKEVAALGEDRAVRDPEAIRAEIEEVREALSELRFRLEQEKEKLARWKVDFKSLDLVTDGLVELKGEEKEKRAQLAGLKPRPEEFTSDDRFIESLKEMREKRESLREHLASLKQELFEVQNRMPEQATEDLETELKLLEEELVKLKKEGRAVSLVREEFKEMKEELDADTYTPLVETFTRYLALATGGCYRVAELDGPLPDEIVTADGRAMPIHLLSTGTIGGTALALRLAMSRYLLEDEEGFVIMDDPLISLDPERKQSAAELIREFAAERQLIITTFDPETAALLGGNVLEI